MPAGGGGSRATSSWALRLPALGKVNRRALTTPHGTKQNRAAGEEATARAQPCAGSMRTSGWVPPDTCPLIPMAPAPPLLYEQGPGPVPWLWGRRPPAQGSDLGEDIPSPASSWRSTLRLPAIELLGGKAPSPARHLAGRPLPCCQLLRSGSRFILILAGAKPH